MSEEALDGVLFGLRMLGYVSTDDGGYRLSNWFFERWLRRVLAAGASAERSRSLPEQR
jgi:hypothetical protein